jgi:hypothetical protein
LLIPPCSSINDLFPGIGISADLSGITYTVLSIVKTDELNYAPNVGQNLMGTPLCGKIIKRGGTDDEKRVQ